MLASQAKNPGSIPGRCIINFINNKYVYRRMKTKLTLSIDKETLKIYKQFCEDEGIIISKQVENLMKKTVKKEVK